MKKLLIALALLLIPSAASAQCTGRFPANTLCGNLTGVAAPPHAFPAGGSHTIGPATTVVGDVATWANVGGTLLADTTPSAVIDEICSTDNDLLVRITGTWQCGPAAGTAGRILIDQGAGTTPLFEVASGSCTVNSSGVFSCTSSTERTILSADTDFYVNSSTGSDSNPCSVGSPCQHLQYTYEHLAGTLDGLGFSVNIHLVGAGPYTLSSQIPWVGMKYVNIIGAGATTTRINDLTFFPVVGATTAPVITINNVLLGTSSTVNDILVYGGSIILGATLPSNATSVSGHTGSWALAPVTSSGVMVQTINPFAVLNIYGTGTLNTGTSAAFIAAGAGSFIVNFASSVTIQASSVFTFFVDTTEGGLIEDHCTAYSGSPTSTFQFYAYAATLYNSTGSPTFWPGDKPGWILPNAHSDIPVTVVSTPTTGGTVVLSGSQPNQILTPAGILSTLTLQLPPAATVFASDGYVSHITSTQTITNLTVSTTDGSTVVGAPASLTANIPLAMQYNAANNAWYPYIESAAGAGGSGITSLFGDVVATGPGAASASVAKIAGVPVGTPTGTGNVVFSNVSTLSNTTLAGVSTFTGALKVPVRTAVSTTDSISATTDYFVCPLNTSGAATENLPAGANGLTFLIKDCGGNAATHSITIVSISPTTIDGVSLITLGTNYQSTAVTYNGTQWSQN